MIINVPDWAKSHFWEEPPVGSREFWAFRFLPKAQVGDPITFRMDGKVVAGAVVSEIQKPGVTECDSTGRFKRSWKVFWEPETFVDLRE